MLRRPPRSTQSRSSAASDVYKRQTVKSSSTTAAPTSEPSLTTTSTTIAEDPVLVAYLDFWELYVELGAAPPPFDPIAVNARLEELTTDPESAQLFDFFQRNAATGLVLRGDIGHTPTVLSNDGTTAMVDDCADDRLGVYRVADDSRVDTDDPARRTYTATLRQATEDVLAFGVVVSEQDADQIERTHDVISRLGLIWRGLSNQLAVAAAPALEAVANAMAAVASRTGPLGIAIRGLFDNIGRLTTYAATFATLMAGRWVAGLAAAALSVRGLATGLVILRGALIRTGIGALIVGAGELVFQFTRVVPNQISGCDIEEAFQVQSGLGMFDLAIKSIAHQTQPG